MGEGRMNGRGANVRCTVRGSPAGAGDPLSGRGTPPHVDPSGRSCSATELTVKKIAITLGFQTAASIEGCDGAIGVLRTDREAPS